LSGAAPRARFLRAFGPGSRFPDTARAEIAFCGRSNVGKSSLLNALTGVKGLARTSKTPGRTREIHFYEEGTDRFLVDLPGYGYAKVSRAEQATWQGLVEGYFERAGRIALAVLLVDSRHPPFASDLGLGEGLAARGIPYLVVLTKADRATMSERARAANRALGAFIGAQGALLTSSKTGAGLRELAGRIEGAIEGWRRGLPGAEKSGKIKRFRSS
jgi:GTP-binding protein